MKMERRLVAPTNTSPGYRLPSETRPGNERGMKCTFVRGEEKGETAREVFAKPPASHEPAAPHHLLAGIGMEDDKKNQL